MAIMIPSIPLKFTPASDEDKIFYALKNLPGDPNDKKNDYYVFHSLRINQIDKKTNTLVLHETDFVIFHPSKGILCIESKSGKAICRERVWHYAKADEDGIWKIGSAMSHGGPFQQAQDRMHDLLQYIDNQQVNLHGDPNKSLKTHCKALFAVCFPKIESVDETYRIKEKNNIIQKTFEDNFNGTENLKDLVIYGGELNDEDALKKKIDNIFNLNIVNSYAKDSRNGEGTITTGYKNGERVERLHDEDIQNLFDRVLCPNFNIVETIDSNTGETKYVQINQDQIRVLDILMAKKEMAISGMAGTGKTILALQLARKKALQDEKVLFLCRSSYQKKELEEQEKSRQGNRAKIIFRDIDWLRECWHNLDKTPVENKNGFYDFLCICIAKEAGKKKKNFKLNTIIVDEAQDFCKNEAFDGLKALHTSIKDVPVLAKSEDKLLKQRFRERTAENKNAFYIFYDEFQTDDNRKILEFAQEIKNHIELEKNCRNTFNIAKMALKPLIDVDHNYCQRRDSGEKVVINFYEGREVFNCKLEEWKYHNEFYYEEEFCFKLDNILRDYDLTPKNTVILTLKGEDSGDYSQIKGSVLFDYPERLVDREGNPVNVNNCFVDDLELFYKLDEERRFLFSGWKNFQGLEKRNVIIVDFDPTRFFDKVNESYMKKFYVTLTRAQDFCFILSLEPDYDTGFEYSDMCEQAEIAVPGSAEYDMINDIRAGDSVLPVLEKEYDGYDSSKKAFKLLDTDEDFWKSVGIALENEDQEAIAEYCKTYEIDERLLEECYEEYYFNTDEFHIEMIESEERVHDQLNPAFLNSYKYGRRSASMRKAIAEALGAENVFNEDVKKKLEDNYLEEMVSEVEKAGIPRELFHHDIFNMKYAWKGMRYFVNNPTVDFITRVFLSIEALETYGLNLEFVKNEYERLMNLNIRSERKKLSNEFWEKFKLTRDTGIISANDGISEICTKIGEEKLSQLDKLEKEAMEYLIHLNMKYG